jgi:hypothetical protein
VVTVKCIVLVRKAVHLQILKTAPLSVRESSELCLFGDGSHGILPVCSPFTHSLQEGWGLDTHRIACDVSLIPVAFVGTVISR